ILSSDQPIVYLPKYYNIDQRIQPQIEVTSTQVTYRFSLDVAATVTPSASLQSANRGRYWAEATAAWTFDATGTFNAATQYWTATTPPGVTASTSWTAVGGPTRED